MKYRLLLFSLILSLHITGQTGYVEKRTVSDKFAVSDNTHLEVSNKYGDIIFTTWEIDSVAVDVEIYIESEKYENAQELLELASVNLEQRGTYIIAETIWGEYSSFWSQTKNQIRGVIGADQKIQIDYHISLPDYLSVDIDNKFGDVFLPPYKGEVTVEMSHGDFRCRNLSNPRKVKFGYGKLMVDEIGSTVLDLEFAEIRISSTQKLNIKSRSSELHIDRATLLEFDSRNDELYLGEIDALNGIFHFTTTEIKKLNTTADIIQNYGSLSARSLDKEFRNIRITPKKSEITLEVSEFIPFNFSVHLTNGEQFASVPELITIKRDDTVGDERQIDGFWKNESKRTIFIKGQNSVVKIAKIQGAP
jgi:hypothetical protein